MLLAADLFSKEHAGDFLASLGGGNTLWPSRNLFRGRTRKKISEPFSRLLHQISKQWLFWSLKWKDHIRAGEQRMYPLTAITWRSVLTGPAGPARAVYEYALGIVVNCVGGQFFKY